MANKNLASRMGTRKAEKAPPPKVSKASNRTAPSVSSKKETDWEAESDAHTIARAAAIKADPDRRERAAKAARRIIEEKTDELRGLKSIARGAK